MAVNKKLWKASFQEDAFPTFPCPTCRHGHLAFETAEINQSEHSKILMQDDFATPEHLVERFRSPLKCTSGACGEIVEVVGDTSHEERGGWNEPEYVRMLHPKTMYPAPPIIAVPDEMPEKIQKELNLAFQFYWTNLGTSASRLRASVERLMDDQRIPKTNGAAGKSRKFLNLAARITRLGVKKPEHKDSFDALRQIGNLGTHSDVTRESLLAGFEIFEHVLAEIYGERTKKISQLTKRIIKGRGKLSQSRD